MSRKPINADVPAAAEEQGGPAAPKEEERDRPAVEVRDEPAALKPEERGASPPPKPERLPESAPPRSDDGPVEAAEEEPAAGRQRRPRVPMATRLLGAAVALAVLFILAAVLFAGGGGHGQSGESRSAPAPGPKEEPPTESAEALGYPSFATNNTTRVGGPDATTEAAGVSLAVFPSTTASQRPAAVTLVAEEDWAGAIAASVLMAAPVRAPVLFSAPGALPDPSAEALKALDPRGSKATGGASLFAIGDVALPPGAGRTTRVDSGDPASTAAQIATLRDRLFGSPATTFLVASSSAPEFAMPAAAWAARSGDPVLYAGTGKLPQTTAAVLESHPKAHVYVLGPRSAVGAGALQEIAKIDKGARRIAGKDGVETALALARYHAGDFGWNVNDPGHGFVLARSDEPAAAAAAAALSGSGTWGPLLLSDDADSLPAKVRGYFLDLKPGYTTNPTRAFYNHVWVIGDQEAIDVNEQAEVNQLAELAKIGGEG